MGNKKIRVFGVSRHRMHTDGIGITTIVGVYGCPLRCKYCLNPHAWALDTLEKTKDYTAQELYEKLKIDNLYFLATGGGVVFGGGEPLLYADFYQEFRKVCGTEWRLTIETSLNIERKELEKIIDVIDDYIIDIKDINPVIYKKYTSRENTHVLENLKFLLTRVNPKHICVRVPHIPEFNDVEDVKKSIDYVKDLGVTLIDKFTYIRAHKEDELW